MVKENSVVVFVIKKHESEGREEDKRKLKQPLIWKTLKDFVFFPSQVIFSLLLSSSRELPDNIYNVVKGWETSSERWFKVSEERAGQTKWQRLKSASIQENDREKDKKRGHESRNNVLSGLLGSWLLVRESITRGKEWQQEKQHSLDMKEGEKNKRTKQEHRRSSDHQLNCLSIARGDNSYSRSRWWFDFWCRHE